MELEEWRRDAASDDRLLEGLMDNPLEPDRVES